jgi:hypothetical protein
MKKEFDAYTSSNRTGVCPAEPAAQKASHVFVQNINIDSDVLSEMKNSNKVAEREGAR